MNLVSAADRMQQMFASAAAFGIDLNYAPEIVVDTEKISNEEWQASMAAGIGSSSAGEVMGVSHFGDEACLVLKKQGRLPKENIDAEKQFLFDFGHAVEEPLLKYFGSKMNFKVFVDRNRYRHPKYPFLFADLDGIAIDNDGMRVVVEVKSCSPNILYGWKDGVFGAGGACPNEGYVYQAVHHLSVMNLDRLYWVAGATNSASDIRIVRFDRNFQLEQEYLKSAGSLWLNYVQTGSVPELVRCTDQAFKIRKSMYSSDTGGVMSFGDEMRGIIGQYFAADEQLSTIKEKYSTPFNERKNALKIKILDAMNGCEKGVLTTDDYVYTITYRNGSNAEKIDLKELQLLHPEIIETLKAEGIITESQREPVMRITRRVNRKCKDKKI